MTHFLHAASGFIHGILRDWDPKATAGMGLAAVAMPSFEAMTRFLGAVALVVGIYCSVSRELREGRVARRSSGPRPR